MIQVMVVEECGSESDVETRVEDTAPWLTQLEAEFPPDSIKSSPSRWTDDHLDALALLYSRRVMRTEPAEDRIERFRMIVLNKPPPDAGRRYCEDVGSLHKRLMALAAAKGDVTFASPGDAGVVDLNTFCEVVLPQWAAAEPGVVVFPRDFQCAVYRLQSSSTLCSMHAAITAVHYAMRRLGCPSIAMVDMTRYMREVWTPEELTPYVSTPWYYSGKKGSNSIDVLRVLSRAEVLDRDVQAWVEDFGLAEAEQRVLSLLQRHGPAVIAGFQTWDSFGQGAPRYRGATATELPPPLYSAGRGHAMVIIGWRVDGASGGTHSSTADVGSGEFGDLQVQLEGGPTGSIARRGSGTGSLVLLVQNWWRQCPFLEMDLSFLASRRSRLAWIVSTSLSRRSRCPTCHGGVHLQVEDPRLHHRRASEPDLPAPTIAPGVVVAENDLDMPDELAKREEDDSV